MLLHKSLLMLPLLQPRAPAPRLQLPGANAFGLATPNPDVPVDIVVSGPNSRDISSSIIINATPAQVWSIITDYDNLATYVPNLVESSRRPHPSDGIRVFQEGAQNITGFDFRASLTMDMAETADEGANAPTRLKFSLVESAVFAEFDGVWRVQPYSRVRSRTDPSSFEYRSKLTYSVHITPRGLVPVPVIEWQVREEVPNNLMAVKVEAERRVNSAQGGIAR